MDDNKFPIGNFINIEPYRVLMVKDPISKNVKISKHLIKLARKFVGENKPYPSLAQFANQSFRNELEKRGIKV